MKTAIRRSSLLAAIVSSFLGSTTAVADTRTVNVDCSRGQTIAKALGDERRSLLILVQGVCNETVTIDREDITLRGEAGAAINGPDPALDTVTVRADRVAIENLVVSGGKNGVVASGAGNFVMRGATVQSTGRTGVLVVSGSSATIDGSTVQSNPRDGVSTEGSHVTMMNSVVRQNGRIGVLIATNTSGRIGLDPVNEPAGNTITQNGANGIAVTLGSSALIGNNSVTFNGADPASTAGRSGIGVTGASADILGGNTIANNAAQGIFVSRGTVTVGSITFPFTSVNTISGNGGPTFPGGINAFLGGTLFIRDAVISGNHGGGLVLGGRSQAQVLSTQILNNLSAGTSAGDGVRLFFGSALFPGTPASVVTGNAGAGVVCFDGESSAGNLLLMGSSGNGAPDNCSGF